MLNKIKLTIMLKQKAAVEGSAAEDKYILIQRFVQCVLLKTISPLKKKKKLRKLPWVEAVLLISASQC